MKVLPVNQPRIFGIETEYGLYPSTDKKYTTEDINAVLPEYLHSNKNGFNEFGRIYAEISSNIEVSTPELISLRGLQATYFASEELAGMVVRELFKDGTTALKRSIDSSMTSRGEHENYLTGSDATINELSWVANHLATRPVVTGSGMVIYEQPTNVYHYAVDQRGLVTTRGIYASGSVPQSKPFIKSNSEAFDRRLGEQSTRRLEIVSGSHNMYAYPIAARIFNTSSVLRLIEHGQIPEYLELQNPVRAIVTTASDPRLRAKLPMRNGKAYTALQVQYELMQNVLKLDLPDDEKNMATLTAKITSDLMDGQHEKWQGHIEWLGKKKLLEQHAEKAGYPFPRAESAVIDIKMHFAGDNTLINSLRRKGKIAMMPSREDIEAAMRGPLDPTRAQLRSKAIAEAALEGVMKEGEYIDINWNCWQIGPHKKVTVNDAYANQEASDNRAA